MAADSCRERRYAAARPLQPRLHLEIHKKADVWSGLALAGLGTYVILAARHLEYLGPNGPGAGFFPLWYGIAMVALSLALVVSSVTRQKVARPGGERDGDPGIEWPKVRRALATWLACVATVAASTVVGLVISLGLLTFFIVAVVFRRPLGVATIVALALALGFYIVFPLALGVSVPTGVFGF